MISVQIAREFGMDVPEDRPAPKPTPRPAGWGDKRRARARAWAQGYLRYLDRRGIERPSVTYLACYIRENVKIGARPALEVAQEVLQLRAL